MNANWRAPTVGIIGQAGMRNPADHGVKTVEKVVEKIIYVDKPVDREVYIVSEEMKKIMEDLVVRMEKGYERLSSMELDLQNSKRRHDDLRESVVMLSHEVNKNNETRSKENAVLRDHIEMLHAEVINITKRPKVTLWGLIKELWQG